MNGHKESEWVIENEAECTKDGLKYKTCLTCKERIAEEVIPMNGHEASDWIIEVEMECTKDGFKYVKCNTCGERLIEEAIKASHNVQILPKVLSTCTKTGLTEGSKCDVCNSILVAQEVIKALGHNIVIDKGVAATCTKTGLTEGQHCTRCTEATIKQNVISKTSHKVVTDKAVAPTCTKTGLTEGQHCSECKTVIKAQRVEAALGHDFDIAINKCTRCSKKYTDQEIKSDADFNKDFDPSKPIAIYLDMISISTDSNKYTYITLDEDEVHIILIGTAGKNYNVQIRWNPKNNARLDLGNVTLKPNVAVDVIKIGTAVDFTVGLYGESSNLYGAKAGLKDNYTLSGGDGATGVSAISAKSCNLTIEVGTTNSSKITGGAGGDGQKGTYPGAEGGNGGTGGTGIVAKSISVIAVKNSSTSKLIVSGGAGGSGAKGGLLGSSGSDGSKGKQANVTIIYR